MPQRFIICLLLVLFSGLPNLCRAQEGLTEADLKAAFLYNFTKFVEWPSNAFAAEDSPFVVGIIGDEEFAATLRKLLQDKKAHGHPFLVRRLTQNGEASACQILFVRESEMKRFNAIFESIKRLPILTVGESEEFLEFGGMFNLLFEDKQLRFEVNPGPAENAGLKVSSKVLRLAKKIRKGASK